MKKHHSYKSNIHTLTAHEAEQVGGGYQFGTVGVDRDGQYEIVPTNSKSPLYINVGGRWVPLGTEPFIGPPASELGI